MDLLIIERDGRVAEVFADALAEDGIEAEIIGDDRDAVAAWEPDAPRALSKPERILAKPVSMLKLVRTVRELLPA
jgi:hypothetical protein